MKPHDTLELLAASGPFAEDAGPLMLYGQFVGSWSVDATWYKPDGERRTGKGEWHFRWILGGRGVQDVLFHTGAAAHECGTTLRGYDRTLGVWHIVWMHPASGEFVHMLGRRVGDRIVQEEIGVAAGRRARWSFTEITPGSFLWLGEVSFDEGATWFLEQEMRARRIQTGIA